MRKVQESARYMTERVDTSVGRLWVTLDSDFHMVDEVREFAVFQRAAGKSENTVRQYVPRVTMFLNWAHENAVDWKTVTLAQMARFKWFIESEPIGAGRVRAPGTVNIIITGVVEFLRFAGRAGFIDSQIPASMTEQKYISHGSAGFDPGENGQFRNVRATVLHAREMQRPPRALDDSEWRLILAACLTARDTFTVRILHDAGLRIGEALGLRRSDLHFMINSDSVGCRYRGPHIHVERRSDNVNHQYAKSVNPRVVPASPEVVASYERYRQEKAAIAGASATDYVFVNLYNGVIGSPQTYSAAIKVFNRLRETSGVDFAPHALRHTAATNWLHEGGVALDTVQSLLGHASPSSTMIYLHASDVEKRAAVQRVSDILEGGL